MGNPRFNFLRNGGPWGGGGEGECARHLRPMHFPFSEDFGEMLKTQTWQSPYIRYFNFLKS